MQIAELLLGQPTGEGEIADGRALDKCLDRVDDIAAEALALRADRLVGDDAELAEGGDKQDLEPSDLAQPRVVRFGVGRVAERVEVGLDDAAMVSKASMRTKTHLMNAPSSVVASSSSPLMRRMARPTWKRTFGPKKKKQSMRRKAKTSGMLEMYRDMNQGNDATES